MDSAFTIADRMAMLDKGRILKVETRQWYERVRDMPVDEARSLNDDDRLIRQFLRGDPDRPITDSQKTSGYEQALFGAERPGIQKTPSVEATRG